jgi:hypothetical protein
LNAACIGCIVPSAAASPSIRQHRGAVRLRGEDGAGLHGIAIEMHGAGAALAGVAADVRARERKLVPQEIDQKRARIDVRGDLLAVDGKRKGDGHRASFVGDAAAGTGSSRRGEP